MKIFSKNKYSLSLDELLSLFNRFIDINIIEENKIEIIQDLISFINNDISLNFSFYVNSKRYTIWQINNQNLLKQYDSSNINGFTNCFEITDRDNEIDLNQLFLFNVNKKYLSYILLLFIIYTLNDDKTEILKIIEKENCSLK